MKNLFTGIVLCIAMNMSSQTSGKIITSDIDNFWIAYDRIQTTSNHSQKLSFINDLYISKGTKGLKAFMEARDYNDTLYVELIDAYPHFWNSIRANTLTIKNKANELNAAVARLKKIYPDLRDRNVLHNWRAAFRRNSEWKYGPGWS